MVYFPTSYAAGSFVVSTTASPSNTLAVLVASTITAASSSPLASINTVSSISNTPSHVPHFPTHTSLFSFSDHRWTRQPATPTSSPRQNSPTHQPISTSTIVGIVFGALAGCVFVLSLLRCCWSWRKTPPHDRIESLIHRHNLQREMEEAMVAPLRVQMRPPPPPYRPPPPGYESVMPSSPPPAHRDMPPSVSS